MRSSPRIRLFLALALGVVGCAQPPDEGSGGASVERAETTESPVSPGCSYCLQACQVSLNRCRYLADGGALRCEITRGGCASRCRLLCR
jgi:hypothetical protein